MHEYSIVQSLIESCEEHVKTNSATRVTKVVIKIGVVSGVEPYLLESAFELFKEETVCDGCAFVMNIQKVKIECNSCNSQSELEKNEYCCPNCNGVDIEVLDGEEMFLMQLELE
ncbi:hydrogenase maturation nickel metallochaperone HypA [Sulfurovum sp. bin170]|uniref:hydrogenase maturation nickel metallochaperone HypA n=1 Tax=Sulfurovum sp. bin170 TaxID=2695268 RepID=UPI0013DFE77E|nr:hydrogenase maturation nickel metallochaperone HypA [Sulfurovum sp. bin170]NEW59997.1 hydrogenase maturation nickel metallochaperone HypA [Sulfurovum sp. bin170]